jgi:hypothetical protein
MADPNEDRVSIVCLLDGYFDGLYYSDVTRLQQVLHPAALYATTIGGVPKILGMEEYWPVIAVREAPAVRNQIRRDKILALDLVGPETASAKVECAIGDYFYTDVLSLIKFDGRWWIISKVFQATSLGS